jgi:hypothetical protein
MNVFKIYYRLTGVRHENCIKQQTDLLRGHSHKLHMPRLYLQASRQVRTMQTHEGINTMMRSTQSGIQIEVSGNIRRKTEYALEDKLQKLTERLNSEMFETITHRTHIHEPASYNDYKKTKIQHIEVKMRIPELTENEGMTRLYKSGLILAGGHNFEPILKEFKGFKFDGITCHLRETNTHNITVQFSRESRV